MRLQLEGDMPPVLVDDDEEEKSNYGNKRLPNEMTKNNSKDDM